MLFSSLIWLGYHEVLYLGHKLFCKQITTTDRKSSNLLIQLLESGTLYFHRYKSKDEDMLDDISLETESRVHNFVKNRIHFLSPSLFGKTLHWTYYKMNHFSVNFTFEFSVVVCMQTFSIPLSVEQANFNFSKNVPLHASQWKMLTCSNSTQKH